MAVNIIEEVTLHRVTLHKLRCGGHLPFPLFLPYKNVVIQLIIDHSVTATNISETLHVGGIATLMIA